MTDNQQATEPSSSISDLQHAISDQIQVQRQLAQAELLQSQELARQNEETIRSRKATEAHVGIIQLLIDRINILIESVKAYADDDQVGVILRLLEVALPVILRQAGSAEEIRRLERLLTNQKLSINTVTAQQAVIGNTARGEQGS